MNLITLQHVENQLRVIESSVERLKDATAKDYQSLRKNAEADKNLLLVLYEGIHLSDDSDTVADEILGLLETVNNFLTKGEVEIKQIPILFDRSIHAGERSEDISSRPKEPRSLDENQWLEDYQSLVIW